MIIDVTNFCKGDNASLGIQSAIASCNQGDTLLFQKEEYHFYRDFSQSRVIHMTNTDSFGNPLKYFGMLFEGLQDVTIDGNGAVFCIHGDMCALALLNCANIRLKNFTVRYPSPSNIEFKVTEVKRNSVKYRLSTDAFEINGKSITFFEKSPFSHTKYFAFSDNQMTDCWVCHTGNRVYRVWNQNSPLSRVKNIKRLSQNEIEIKYIFRPLYKTGEIYAISPNSNRHTCGIFFHESSNIESENIQVNYLAGFGWLSQKCENLSFRHISFSPDKEHHVSSFADLIHICSCRGNVKIQDSSFEHPHDDAINIHGSFLRFREKKDDYTAVFEFVHKQQGGYRAFDSGDRCRLYFRTDLSALEGEYTVKNAVDSIEDKTVSVTFNERLPKDIERKSGFESNVVIENISCCPDVEISGCTFKAIPTRGILCTTSGEVKIHNNRFSNIRMAHIFISNDAADWYESGPVRNMEIFNNNFDNQKTYAVLIEPVTKGRSITNHVHENISIHSNRIENKKNAVKAIGVKNLVVKDNI